MKYLEYDEITGIIKDGGGLTVTTSLGYSGIEIEKETISTTEEMIKLKNAGFTAQDIIEIKKAGL